MEYLHAGWPPHLIRDEFNLSATQMSDVMAYIETHRDEVEQEYCAVLQYAEENRQYWDAQNRARLAHMAPPSPQPGQEKLHAKLQAAKARLGME
jgi:hypothetical protein